MRSAEHVTCIGGVLSVRLKGIDEFWNLNVCGMIIQPESGRDLWWAVVNMVMNVLVPQEVGNFLST
jgi:hypothetical protein